MGSATEIHSPVMAVPVALEQLFLVVLALEQQELPEAGVADVDLLAQRVAVVGEVVAAAVLDADVDQPAEGVAGADRAARRVLDVRVASQLPRAHAR